MVIANPIYDVVFKILMDDIRIARFFIETLIEETIEDIEVKPQEFNVTVYTEEQELAIETRLRTVYSMDYIATIKTKEEGHKKVLIEIQKARNTTDVMRFRNYLAHQYKTEDIIETAKGKKKMALPVITIYLLGFKLPNVESPAIKIGRNYMDLITHKVIEKKVDFIEQLTHDSFVVQIPRIEKKIQTKLEELLSVFEQSNFLDTNGTIKNYPYKVKNPIVKSILKKLNTEGVDPEKRQGIENEIEAWRTIEASFGNQLQDALFELEEAQKALEVSNKEMEAKNKEMEAKNKALEEKEKELEQLRQMLNKIK